MLKVWNLFLADNKILFFVYAEYSKNHQNSMNEEAENKREIVIRCFLNLKY